VRKKIDRHILPLMCVLYLIQYMDKATLGNAAVSNGRLQIIWSSLFFSNWLSSIFYFGYLVFEYPQSLSLQRFPVAKWMALNVFSWGIILCSHAACTNFGGLFTVRLLLGVCEGSITPAFMLITSMFYTRQEQTKRVGYWPTILSSFMSFGIQHIQGNKVASWQWLMIITGMITLILAVCVWFYFPDSPATAWFLSHEERIIAVQRLKVNQTGIGNKRFKREQFIETLKDKKTWLFAAFTKFGGILKLLTNQRTIIIQSFGFTTMQTLLLNCVPGVISILSIWSAITLAARYKNLMAYTAILYFVPHDIASILMLTLPWSNKIGLLMSLYVTGIGSANYTIFIGWVIVVTAGH
ncbi:hypothetical protein M422DRAFT_129392, partial [Sphaerobolus stellatus SS14]